MKWKSLPAWIPAALLRRPLLLAAWLPFMNRLERWRRERPRGMLAIIAAIIVSAPLVLWAFASQANKAVAVLAEYWVITAVVTALYAASSLAKRRRRIQEAHSQSWLIAAPVSAADVHWSIVIRSLLPLVGLWLAISAVMLGVLAWGGAGDNAVSIVIGAITGGAALGAFMGWFAANKPPRDRFEASRYVPHRRSHQALRPDYSALASWSVMQALAWSRPENSRYVVIMALLSVQGGATALSGLCTVLMFLLVSYLTALLSAVIRVSETAGRWLRATPMTLSEFVWVLARRVLLHQTLGTVLAGVFLSLMGTPFALIVQLAALWLGTVVSVSGCSLLDRYRGRSPAMRLAVSLATLAAVAAAWQVRAGAKS